MARLAGFEPATTWFEARYSIQLSYSRIRYCVHCFKVARLGGFEPPTAWFVARYSIQLSYSRVSSNFHGGERGIRTLDGRKPIHP